MNSISTCDNSFFGLPASTVLPHSTIKSLFQKMIKENVPNKKLNYLKEVFETVSKSLKSEHKIGKR